MKHCDKGIPPWSYDLPLFLRSVYYLAKRIREGKLQSGVIVWARRGVFGQPMKVQRMVEESGLCAVGYLAGGQCWLGMDRCRPPVGQIHVRAPSCASTSKVAAPADYFIFCSVQQKKFPSKELLSLPV